MCANKWLVQPAGAAEYTDCISSKGQDSPTIKCLGHDIKQSDGEVAVKQELWGVWSTPLLPSLPGSVWPGLVAPDRVLSRGQIELNWVLILKWIVWNRTVLIFNCVQTKNSVVWKFNQNDFIWCWMTQKGWHAIKQSNQPTNKWLMLSCYCYKAILETIWLSITKWLMVGWLFCFTVYQPFLGHLKPD